MRRITIMVHTERDINFLLRKYYQTTPSRKPLTHLPKKDRYEEWSSESMSEYLKNVREKDTREIMDYMCREYRVSESMQYEAIKIMEHLNLYKLKNWSKEQIATMLLLYLRCRDHPKYLYKHHYSEMLEKEGLNSKQLSVFLMSIIPQLKTV